MAHFWASTGPSRMRASTSPSDDSKPAEKHAERFKPKGASTQTTAGARHLPLGTKPLKAAQAQDRAQGQKSSVLPQSSPSLQQHQRIPSRRRFIACLLLLALFPLGLFAQEKIKIVTKTELHSANWIWNEAPRIMEYSEYDDKKILEGKTAYPDDLGRKTIGIGELINLKLVELTKDAAGDKTKAKWKIVDGAGWAGFSGEAEGGVVTVGATVLDGPSPRTVKVRVTTDTTPKLTAEVMITIVKPGGSFSSRHCGPVPGDVFVPQTSNLPPNHRVSDGTIIPFSPDAIATATRLIVVPSPTDVNFGGPFSGGVHIIEKDIASPPVPKTFTPSQDSLFARGEHFPNPSYVALNGSIAGFFDQISIVGSKPQETLLMQHTCVWTCEWRWNDAEKARKHNERVGERQGKKAKKQINPGGIPTPHIEQEFWITHKSGAGAAQVINAKISKFNSSVTRDTGAADSTRDIENNWKP
jgi:hypothetical protein